MARRDSFSVATAVLLMSSLCAPQPAGARQTIKEKDRNDIMELWRQGKPLVDAGLATGYKDARMWEEQVRIFSKASSLLTRWIGKYVKDKKSLEYLKDVYRLGNFWEYAGNWRAAQQSYLICSVHPLLKTSRAKYGNEPIEKLVEERLAKTALAIKARESKTIMRPGYMFVQDGDSQALHEEPDPDAVFPPAAVEDGNHICGRERRSRGSTQRFATTPAALGAAGNESAPRFER